MATPIYKGKPAAANSGWLDGVGTWVSGSTPAYAGQSQYTRPPSGFFGSVTPAYKPAPPRIDGAVSAPDTMTAEADSECPDEPERITVLIPRELIEPQKAE